MLTRILISLAFTIELDDLFDATINCRSVFQFVKKLIDIEIEVAAK